MDIKRQQKRQRGNGYKLYRQEDYLWRKPNVMWLMGFGINLGNFREMSQNHSLDWFFKKIKLKKKNYFKKLHIINIYLFSYFKISTIIINWYPWSYLPNNYLHRRITSWLLTNYQLVIFANGLPNGNHLHQLVTNQ